MIKLEGILIGLLIFAGVITTFMTLATDFNTNYASENLSINTSKFAGTAVIGDNIRSNITAVSHSMKGSTLEADLSDNEVENLLFKGAYNTLLFIPRSFGLVGSVIKDIALQVGIDKVWIGIAITAFLIAVIFSIIYLIFRFRN